MTQQWGLLGHYHPMDDFWAAASGPEAAFPQYAFIEPAYFGAGQNDQHPPADIFAGEALIANVYNALWRNAPLWQKTLLVILYDEHGGFYDHVAPPPAVPPDTNTQEFAFNEYGPRVPALLISPWLDHQVVSDVFDHTSLLKYVTDKWSLGPLGGRVAAAASFGRYLTQRSSARLDTPEPLAAPQFTPAAQAPEMNANQNALVAFSRFLETKIADAAGHSDAALKDIGQRLVTSMEDVGHHAEVAVQRLETFLHLGAAG
jgi:phospholipase C